MEKFVVILGDVLTFGLIGLSAALFGFSHADHQAMLIGRIVFVLSVLLAALSLTVKRPQTV